MLQVVQAIILAAGKSQRLKTGRTKLLEPINGQAMILYQTKLLEHLSVPTTLVVGYQKDLIQQLIIKEHGAKAFLFVEQFEQKGTGDALKCTQHLWLKDHILIMNGDVPLITEEVIELLHAKHLATNATITFITSHDEGNSGYGKVVRRENRIMIVERTDYQLQLQGESCCINAGIYLFKKSFLQAYIDKLIPNSLTGEYYITELIAIASGASLLVETVHVPFDRIRGINTQEELAATEQINRADIIRFWMEQGVRFIAPQNTYVDVMVKIGKGSTINPGVHLLGKTQIGEQVIIEPFAIINNSVIESKVFIKAHSVIEHSTIGQEATIGPFAFCRNNTHVATLGAIGSFVECKNAHIDIGSKAKHLSYLGDVSIGKGVNIGGGTIVANHNGVEKNPTVIQDNVYVGANSVLVAPVILEEKSFIAAGSTITNDVPKETLAIARSRQVNKLGYAVKLRSRKVKSIQALETDQILDGIDQQSQSTV